MATMDEDAPGDPWSTLVLGLLDQVGAAGPSQVGRVIGERGCILQRDFVQRVEPDDDPCCYQERFRGECCEQKTGRGDRRD